MAYTGINKSSEHFNTKLWTGTGSSNALTGVGFQPDLVWIKNRTDANSHVLQDAVRGVGNTIISNNTDAQSAEGAGDLTAFGSDGFTVGTNGRVNGSGKNMVAWNWLANGAGSANTDGSITSTVSANTTAGFSIVKVAKPNTNVATIGHGLGDTPKFIIGKDLDGADNWTCYHEGIGNGKGIYLNATNAETSASSFWNSTSPTNSVFTIGSDNTWNSPSILFYCFADVPGYSKFGSYTGNESTNGNFVYLGFKPAFLLVKSTGTISDWWLTDNKRNTFNAQKTFLRPNQSGAESEPYTEAFDFLSNGFKVRAGASDVNRSSGIIYMAFAEAPLVGSNNVPCTAR